MADVFLLTRHQPFPSSTGSPSTQAEDTEIIATERQLQETIARCASIMVYFENGRRAPRSREMMVAEVHIVAGRILDLGLDAVETERRILREVKGELIDRYGLPGGTRLNSEFAKAFATASGTCPIPRPAGGYLGS